jgi:hypothetical protein
MKELFEKLLKNDLLTEETRKELEADLTKYISEQTEAAKAEAQAQVRAELTEQFVADKEALIEALDTKTEELLKVELEDLKEDIEKFRDLEAEYATKLVEARAEMAEQVKKDMAELVETLDAFLEERLTEEFAELNESIQEVRKLEMGREIFEAVAKTYEKNFFNKDETAEQLKAANADLENTKKALKEAKDVIAKTERDAKLGKLLESLQGRPREVMEAILKNVQTDKLEESYKTYIGRVLHESAASTTKVVEEKSQEKESEKTPVLAEGDTSTASETKETVIEGNVVTGDTVVTESDKNAVEGLTESEKKRLKKLAGIVIG